LNERDREPVERGPIGLASTMASPVDVAATATDPGASSRRSGDLAPARDPDALVGRRLAHFMIERRLGQGGMGQVYLATDLALDRPVALKLLSPEIASRPGLRERFYREARAQARIHHPNVGHIYYIGEDDGKLFFAMEYIEGESVQQLLDREGRLSPERALEICRMAALGLREGQRLGFAHRDVKPSNLMIDRHGVVKVLDFGLVKEIGPAGDMALSQEAAVLGTPLYLSPEQASGEPIDFRSDIYALGVTLHQLVSGRPPFEGDTPIAIISRHLAHPRPRLELGGRHKRLRAGLDALCDRMMAKRPADRFASYDDLLAGIERLSAAHSPPAGFWVRAFAAVFDFFALCVLLIPLGLVADIDGNIVLVLLAVPYSIFPTARWGKTLGKMVLQIEVTPVHRAGPPGWRQAAIRFMAQLGPSFLLFGGGDLLKLTLGDGGIPRTIAVSMIVLGFAIPLLVGITAAFTPGKRALWDRAARTQVRYVLR
jgi:uncharacterized RDD family membrane protein YckC